jgi:manganese transport protein
VYVHSALTQRRSLTRSDRDLRAQRVDIAAAMSIAGAVNLAMVLIGAAALSGSAGDIVGMHGDLVRNLGGTAGFAFAVSLLSSGLASSGVGTYAGEVVMTGYLRRRISRPVRRAITLAPTLVLLALGVQATSALVISQVVLSFGIPFTLITLIAVSRDRSTMGRFVNRRVTTAAAVGITTVIVLLNGYLLVDAVR